MISWNKCIHRIHVIVYLLHLTIEHIQWIHFLSLSSNTLVSFVHSFLLLVFIWRETHLIVCCDIWPKNSKDPLLNSSLISYIFLSTIPTKFAAAGCLQTKSWFRMWLMDRIMFFCTSFNFHELYTTSDNTVAFSVLSWKVSVADDRNNSVSLNQLRLCCKGSGVSKVILGGVSGVFPK